MAISGVVRGLTWQDFTEQDDPPEGADELAYTRARFRYTWDFVENPKTHVFAVRNVNVSVEMLRDESWVVRGSQTAALLVHEQGHYDITALGARDLDRRLPTLTASSASALRSAVASLASSIQAEIDAMNVRYDGTSGGTNHGRDPAAQTRWSGAIATALANPAATLASIVPSGSSTP